MSRQVEKLTARERQILDLVATGLRNREIAMQLSIAEATVENHLHNVFSKLGVRTRVQAAICAVPIQDQLSQKNEGNPS